MSDDIKFEFTEVKQSVEATTKSLDVLQASVQKLDKASVSKIRESLDSLGKLAAFKKLSEEAQSSVDKIEQILSKKITGFSILKQLEDERTKLNSTLAGMKNGFSTYYAEVEAVHKKYLKNQMDLAIQEANQLKLSFSNIESLRTKNIASRLSSATAMTEEDTRALLGAPKLSDMQRFTRTLKAGMEADAKELAAASKQAWADRVFSGAVDDLTAKTKALRSKSATPMSEDDTRALLGMPKLSDMQRFTKTLKAGMEADAKELAAAAKQGWADRVFSGAVDDLTAKTKALRSKSATPMSEDDTRTLLGMPKLSDMQRFTQTLKAGMEADAKELAASKKQAWADRVFAGANEDILAKAEAERYKTTLIAMAAAQKKAEDGYVAVRKASLAAGKLQILGAAKASLDEQHTAEELLAKAESERYQNTLMAMAAAQKKAEDGYRAARAKSLANGKLQILAPARAAVAQDIADDKANAFQYRVDRMFADALVQKASAPLDMRGSSLPEHVKNVDTLSNSFKRLTLDGNDVHSAMRGLASGFNLLWLTWGNLLPLFAGSAVSFGTKGVIELGSSIEHTMQIIRVLSQESSESVQGLTSQLVELAKSGPVGPKEIAEAMKTLSLAGLNTKEVSNAIKDVMNFSVAGDTSLKAAADVMTSVATAFSIDAQHYNYVGDVISKTAAISKASVESIGESFKSSSVLSKLYGLSLEDVGVGLAALSNLGIQGSAAGTALRNMYVDLAGRTPKVAKTLKELGLEVRDSTGKFKDLVTLTYELDASLEKFNGRGQAQKMADVFSERGGKPAVELRALAKERAKEFGTTFGSELERIRSEIMNSEGFMIQSAAQLALTAQKQMESVSATLKATMVDAFEGMSPYIVSISGQLKNLFNSGEFKDSLVGMTNLIMDFVSGLIRVAEVVLPNIGVIAALTAAYAAMPAVVSAATALWGMVTAVIVADTVAVDLNTKAKLANGAASTSVFTSLAGLIPGVGKALALVAGGWMAYETWVSYSARTTEGFVNSGYTDKLIEKLNEETKRINENTQAKTLNMTVDQFRARKAMDQGDATAKVQAIQKQISDLESQLADPTGPALAGGQRVANAMLQKRIADKKEALAQANDEVVIDRMRLQAAYEENAAATKLAAEQARAKAPGKADGLEATAAEKAAKAGKSKREPILRESAIKDSIAAIQRQGDAELQAKTNIFETERKVLQSQHDNHMLTEGTYEARLEYMLEESATAQILIAQKTNDKLLEANEKYDAAERERAEHNIQQVRNAKLPKEEEATRIANIEKQLASELESLNERTRAATEKNNMHIQKITDDSYFRRMEAANKFYGDNWKLVEEQRLAQEKLERNIANSRATMGLARQYDMVTDSTMAFIVAEKAAAEATLSSTQAQIETMAKLDDQIKKNQQTMADFQEEAKKNGNMANERMLDKLQMLETSVKLAEDARAKAVQLNQRESANAAANAYDQVMDKDIARLKQGTADAITTSIVDGGKAGTQKLRSMMVAELRKPIRMVVDVLINSLSSVAGGFLGVGGGAGGMLGSLGSSMATSMFGSTLGSSVLGGQGASGISQFMNGLGSWGAEGSASTVIGGVGSQYSLLEGLGAASPYLAAAAAIYAIASSMDGGEQRSGGSYNLNNLTGTVFKSQGPSGGEIQGTQVQQQTNATITTINSLLSAFGSTAKVDNWMSGLESSKNGKAFAYSGGTINGKAFGESDISQKILMGNMTPEEALVAYTTDLQRSIIEALKTADLGGKIGDYINSLGDIEQMTQDQVTTTLKEINNFQAFTTALKKAPFAYLANASVKTAAALATAAGSIDNLTNAVINYYDLFTTAQQKNLDTVAQLGSEFQKLGVTMPDTSTSIRDWYKAQVAAAGATDLSVAANANAYYSLLQLATAVNTVSTAAEDTVKTRLNWQNQLDVLMGVKTDLQVSLENDLIDVRDAATISLIKAVYAQKTAKAAYDKQLSDAKAAFDRSAAAERIRLEALQAAAQTTVDTFQALFDTLKTNADALYGQVGIGASSANNGNSIIDQALASGVFPSKDVLDQAITAARQGLDAGVYASQADADFAKLVLANKLATLEERAKGTLDTATAQLNAAKDQLTKLDEMVTYAGKLVDIANGIDTSIIDLSTALNTLLGLSKTPGGKPVATTNTTGSTPVAGFGGMNGGAVSGHKGDGNFYQDMNFGAGWFSQQVVDPAAIARYTSIQAGVSDLMSQGASFATIADTAKQYGVSLNDIATATGYNYTDILSAFESAGIPRFASGGLHAGGVRLVGENGPELEVTGPARYYDAGTTAGMIGGGMSSDTEQAIQSMADEIAQLRRDNIKMLEKFTVVSDAFSGRQKMPLLTAAG